MGCKNNDTNFNPFVTSGTYMSLCPAGHERVNPSLAVLPLHHFTLYADAPFVTYYNSVPPEFLQLGINTSAYLQERSLTVRPLKTLELLLQQNLQASLEMLPNTPALHTPCERSWMCLFHEYGNGRGKVRPRTCHEGPKGEKRYSSTLFLTSALEGGG